MGNKKVYIILLNYNGWADTIECLESVYKFVNTIISLLKFSKQLFKEIADMVNFGDDSMESSIIFLALGVHDALNPYNKEDI